MANATPTGNSPSPGKPPAPTPSTGAGGIFYFLRPYAGLYALLFVVVLVAASLEGALVAMILPLANALFGTDSAEGLGFLQRLVALVPIANPLFAAVAFFAGVVMLRAVAELARQWFSAYVTARVTHETKRRVYDHHVRAPYQFFVERQHGALLYALTTAPRSLSEALYILPQILTSTVTVLVLFAVIALVDLRATLLLAALGVLFFALNRLVARRVAYATGLARVASQSEETGLMSEYLQGAKQLKASLAEGWWGRRLEGPMAQNRAIFVRYKTWIAVPSLVIEVLMYGFVVGGAVLSWTVARGNVVNSLPAIGIVLFGAYRMVSHVSSISRLTLVVQNLAGDVEMLRRTFEEELPYAKDGHLEASALRDAIEFQDVGFSYPARAAVLHRASFRIARGKVTALVGASGSGKTTIVNLLLRLYEPTSGAVLVDGTDLRAYARASWLGRVGYVPQETFIFHGTVEENIRFGREAIPRERMVDAAKMAGAHDFIATLPQGYGTMVGDRGMALSGGQRQRIAIARALLADPDLLVFDEATSALDAASEEALLRTIQALAHDRTTLIIAHRPAMAAGADHVVVLREGRVVETGTPAQLLARGGAYVEAVAQR